jgi:hypothetical protein
MERQVIFRDYQEQVATDHNNIQAYAREALDDVVKDAVTNARRYAGLAVTKTGQVEVQVAAGRVYDGGAVYSRRTSLTQSMSTYTAAASKRIVTVSAYGAETETDTQSRDYLVDTDTGTTEPRAVSMTRSRDVQIVFTSGAEAADPVPPAIPSTHVKIADILMDTTQVVSVTMTEVNLVASTAELDTRTDGLEVWKSQAEPRIASIASDLASLQSDLNLRANKGQMGRIFQDLARLKESLRFPDNAADYDADFFLDRDESDTGNASRLGYDALVEEGIRFPTANATEFEISLFSANDPNAKLVSGLLLPKWTDELKISTGTYSSELGIAQYGFKTHNLKQGYMSRSRLRYGGTRHVCSNGAQWNTSGQNPDLTGLYDFNTTGFTAASSISYNPHNWAHESIRFDRWWFDQWKEPFLYTETTAHAILGAQVAQTFLVSNDIWATKLGFFITAKGAAEDIHLTLCETTAGQPDPNKVVMKITYPHASIVVGWNEIAITPTFLRKGERYGLQVISNADHRIGMTSGQNYLEGTFFYSTDGIYQLGDLTKDMMLRVYGARFDASQVAIEFAGINLDGGFRDLDILAASWVPESTQLFWEIRPNGTGEWHALTPDRLNVLDAAPPLAQFRARFVGTRDMAAAIMLTGSRVKASRPKTAFKHVSNQRALATATSTLKLKLLLERFDETPHDCSVKLRRDGVASTTITAGGSAYTSAPTVTFSAPTTGTTAAGTATISGGVVTGITITNPGTGYTAAPTITFSGGGGTGAAATASLDETPDTTVTTLLDASAERYEREFTFNVQSLKDFRVVIDGSTTSAADTYHVAERLYWSL